MNRLLYYAIRLSVYPVAFVLTVLTTKPGIYLLRKIMGKILSELSVDELTVLDAETKLSARVFEEYGVPAVQAIWEQVKIQSERDDKLHLRMFDLINSFPTEERGDQLDCLLTTVFDGEVNLVNAVFNGYVNLINATGDLLAKLPK